MGREKISQIYPHRNASNMILMENKVSQKCNNSQLYDNTLEKCWLSPTRKLWIQREKN